MGKARRSEHDIPFDFGGFLHVAPDVQLVESPHVEGPGIDQSSGPSIAEEVAAPAEPERTAPSPDRNGPPAFDPAAHPHELLIRRIQGRDGYQVSKAERERACETLIDAYRNLIRANAVKTWGADLGVSREDWICESMSRFVEFVINDYLPKEHGGTAVFGSYIKAKHWMRMREDANVIRGRHKRSLVTDRFNFAADRDDDSGPNANALQTALLSMVSNDEAYGAALRREDAARKLAEISQIAERVLDPKDLDVWNRFLLSPENKAESGESLVPPMTGARVHQVIVRCRARILEELGRRAVRQVAFS